MLITAVEFEADPVGHIETQHPDYHLICTRYAIIHCRDFKTGKPVTHRMLVYVKCLPEISGDITERHVDNALAEQQPLPEPPMESWP